MISFALYFMVKLAEVEDQLTETTVYNKELACTHNELYKLVLHKVWTTWSIRDIFSLLLLISFNLVSSFWCNVFWHQFWGATLLLLICGVMLKIFTLAIIPLSHFSFSFSFSLLRHPQARRVVDLPRPTSCLEVSATWACLNPMASRSRISLIHHFCLVFKSQASIIFCKYSPNLQPFIS